MHEFYKFSSTTFFKIIATFAVTKLFACSNATV
jgi:hypothetical protein